MVPVVIFKHSNCPAKSRLHDLALSRVSWTEGLRLRGASRLSQSDAVRCLHLVAHHARRFGRCCKQVSMDLDTKPNATEVKTWTILSCWRSARVQRPWNDCPSPTSISGMPSPCSVSGPCPYLPNTWSRNSTRSTSTFPRLTPMSIPTIPEASLTTCGGLRFLRTRNP